MFNQTPDPSFSQDSSYDLRLMSRSNKILSEPSESVNVSTIGKWLCIDYHEHYMHIEVPAFVYYWTFTKLALVFNKGMCDHHY